MGIIIGSSRPECERRRPLGGKGDINLTRPLEAIGRLLIVCVGGGGRPKNLSGA